MAELEPEGQDRGCSFPKSALVAAGAAVTLASVALARSMSRARLQAHALTLQQVAEDTGLTYMPAQPYSKDGRDFPMLSGAFHGRNARMETEIAGTSIHNHLLNSVTISHNAPVAGFVIVRGENILTRMADHMGLADIQVGEAAFDQRFEVISDLPDAAQLLPPEVRDALLAASFESFVIRQGEITVRQHGPVVNKDLLLQSLHLAVDVAELLEIGIG